MRITSSQPGPGGYSEPDAGLAALNTRSALINASRSDTSRHINFGQLNVPDADNRSVGAESGELMNELAALISGLLKKMGDPGRSNGAAMPPLPTQSNGPASMSGANQDAVAPSLVSTSASPAASPPASTPAAPVAAAPPAPGSATPAVDTAAHSADTDAIDNSKYSSPDELKKYDALVANLPPDQRLQAEKEMNRPIAAAKMVAAGGPDADHAKAFIDANPALKAAADVGKHGGKPDGKTTTGDYSAFAKNMEKARDAATKDVTDYQKAHPNADPQSMQMVISAATLRANEPLIKCGALDKDGKVDSCITADALKGIQDKNPGLSSLLRQSTKTFSQPGFLNLLDQGGLKGKDLALHSPDKKISAKNIDDWIKTQAPTNGGEFSSMMSDAATLNSVAHVDISKLGADIFANPQNYTGEQKAAVMVKLQQTEGQVEGGSSLRKVDKTSQALQEKIAQLQNDPDVKSYLDKAVPATEKNMISADPALSRAVSQRYDDVKSGKALQQDMQTAREAADKANKGKKPEDRIPVDYSSAIGNLDAELQLQGDIQGKNAAVPSLGDVMKSRPDLKGEIERSWNENFVQGKAVESGLKNNTKTDAGQILAEVDQKKAAYQAAIPESVTAAGEDGYAQATMKALTTTKKGMDFLNTLKEAGTLPKESDLKKMTGKEMYNQLREGVEEKTSAMGLRNLDKSKLVGSSALGVASLATVAEQLKSGDKAGAAKTIYDGVKGSAELGKLGFNAAAKALSKDATVGLGRMAGAVTGRVIGAVAGEAAGFAAAETIGATAGPVGWVIDAALGIGFGIKAIIDAINKHKDQKTFDHNVDPTLKQFGIPTPS